METKLQLFLITFFITPQKITILEFLHIHQLKKIALV